MRQRDMFQKNCVSKFCLKKFSLSVATCNYIRYGRGGGQEIKNAICVLGLNMINDKVMTIVFFACFMSRQYNMPNRQCAKLAKFVQVFAILWLWHCILIFAGLNRWSRCVFNVPYSCEPLLIVSVPWICLDTSFKSS